MAAVTFRLLFFVYTRAHRIYYPKTKMRRAYGEAENFFVYNTENSPQLLKHIGIRSRQTAQSQIDMA